MNRFQCFPKIGRSIFVAYVGLSASKDIATAAGKFYDPASVQCDQDAIAVAHYEGLVVTSDIRFPYIIGEKTGDRGSIFAGLQNAFESKNLTLLAALTGNSSPVLSYRFGSKGSQDRLFIRADSSANGRGTLNVHLTLINPAAAPRKTFAISPDPHHARSSPNPVSFDGQVLLTREARRKLERHRRDGEDYTLIVGPPLKVNGKVEVYVRAAFPSFVRTFRARVGLSRNQMTIQGLSLLQLGNGPPGPSAAWRRYLVALADRLETRKITVEGRPLVLPRKTLAKVRLWHDVTPAEIIHAWHRAGSPVRTRNDFQVEGPGRHNRRLIIIYEGAKGGGRPVLRTAFHTVGAD